ncbi:hypothetical protein Tco_1229141 [Tanacetum coccineum]
MKTFGLQVECSVILQFDPESEMALVQQSNSSRVVKEPVVIDGINGLQSLVSFLSLTDTHVKRYKVPTAYFQDVGVSRSVRRRLLTSYSSMPINVRMFLETAETHVGSAYTIENRCSTDKNCVPISTIFDHFRNIRASNIEADYAPRTDFGKRPMSTTSLSYACVDRRERTTAVTETINVARNVRRCLTTS